jgi:hypothetical protein
LNLDHWDLFEPALTRLAMFQWRFIAGYPLEAINTASGYPVWVRDLVFGACNFLDFH